MSQGSFPPKTFITRFPNRPREMAHFGTGCFAVGVKCERVWEHLNGGWIPVFSLVQSARHGTNMAGAIIYAPHLHVRDFCQGCPRTCIRAAWKIGQMLRGCVLHLPKSASIRFKWQVRLKNGAFVCFEKNCFEDNFL